MAATKTKDDWTNTKKEFEKLTGKKKPSESIFKFFRASTHIENALKACDALSDKPAKLSDLKKEFANFQKHKNNYLTLLEKEINAEKEKETKTIYLRGLKMLESRLEKCEGVLADVISDYEHGTDLTAMLDTKIPSAIKACLAAIKHVKASPTAETWNGEFAGGNGVARKLTTALRMIQMVKQKNRSFSYKGDNEATYLKALDEYATGKFMSLSTDREVPDRLVAFGSIIKNVAGAYL